MRLEKKVSVLGIVLMAVIFTVTASGYAVSYVDELNKSDAGETTQDKNKTEEEIKKPGGTDKGVISAGRHAELNAYIAKNAKFDAPVQTMEGEHGETLQVIVVPGMAKEKGVFGHYSLRGRIVNGRNVINIYIDEDIYNSEDGKAMIAHEVGEYNNLVKRAMSDERFNNEGKASLMEAKSNLTIYFNNRDHWDEGEQLFQEMHEAAPPATKELVADLPQYAIEPAVRLADIGTGPRGAATVFDYEAALKTIIGNASVKTIPIQAEFAKQNEAYVVDAVMQSQQGNKRVVIVNMTGEELKWGEELDDMIRAGMLDVVNVAVDSFMGIQFAQMFKEHGPILGIENSLEDIKLMNEAGKGNV
jgi:hypothetical protein